MSTLIRFACLANCAGLVLSLATLSRSDEILLRTLDNQVEAANAWLSLNLQFNKPGNTTSGGIWTAVGKAGPQGFSKVDMYVANTYRFSEFLAPPQLDRQSQFGDWDARNILIRDDLVAPYPLGIGMIGSSFTSTYVDPVGIVPYAGNPNYGSFTGGVAFATGTFIAGSIPIWTSGATLHTEVHLFTGLEDAPVSRATTLLTIRYVAPEPRSPTLAAVAMVVLIRRRR